MVTNCNRLLCKVTQRCNVAIIWLYGNLFSTATIVVFKRHDLFKSGKSHDFYKTIRAHGTIVLLHIGGVS